MNLHVRYKELRSVGEYEHAEAEASISKEVEDLSGDDLKVELYNLNVTVFEAVQEQICAARKTHGLKIGDEVIAQERFSRGISIWTVEEITNKYVYALRQIVDPATGTPRIERAVFAHSEVEKATPRLKKLASLIQDSEV